MVSKAAQQELKKSDMDNESEQGGDIACNRILLSESYALG